MEIALTSDAAALIRRKGGTVALDFVSGIGWGGTSEVSVDTYLKGKDTSGYLRLAAGEAGDVEVLVSPTMARFSQQVSVGTKAGLFGRNLAVEVEHEHGPACRH